LTHATSVLDPPHSVLLVLGLKLKLTEQSYNTVLVNIDQNSGCFLDSALEWAVPLVQISTTVMRFSVSVPVLSVQMQSAFPMVSQLLIFLTKLLSSIILRTL